MIMKKLLLLCVAIATTLMSVGQVSFCLNPPSVNSGSYLVKASSLLLLDWSTPDMSNPVNAVCDTLVIVQGLDSLGCDQLTNGSDVSGNIAVIFRGGCQFGDKAFNAQNAGAIAVVIINGYGIPVGMAGGPNGPNVTIPVVSIGSGTGQLIYDEIMSGLTVTAFIGNKTGYFANDLGITQKDVLRAQQFAIPLALAVDDLEFSVPLGAWVYNYGINDQDSVTLSATVTIGANVLYASSSSPIYNLASGDSVWISLPTFSQLSYSQDYYAIEYIVTSDSVDDGNCCEDNGLHADFILTDNEYAYSSVDQTTSQPLANLYNQPANFNATFGNCIHFKNDNASRKLAIGLTFSAATNNGSSLQNEVISVEAYEWLDPTIDFNSPAFNLQTINYLSSGQFTYSTNSQKAAIYWPFDNAIGLIDSVDYIFCASSTNPNVMMGYDSSLDYDENIWGEDGLGNIHGNGHVTSLSPLGLSTELSSSVMIHMTTATGLEEQLVKVDPAYPNPVLNVLTVPLKGLSGFGTLNILDLSGKIVLSEQVNLSDSILKVDVSSFAAGMYVFNLNLENGKTKTFNVVVSK